MSDYNKPILVTWDFSEKAEEALMHALVYSDFTKADIVLLNIVKKQKEVDDAVKKLGEKIDEVKSKQGKTIHGMVKVGSIFTTISEVIQETEATMAIMGTHGMKGFQKVTGSWALKVIAGSTSPFIVIQEAPKDHEVRNIVVPIDFRAENKEKVIWANFLHKLFHAKFHLCYTDTKDKISKKRLLSNIKVTSEYMHGKGINYELKKLEGKDSNVNEVIEFSKEVEASLILVLTTKNIKAVDYMMGADEQKIIANEEKIPVMCINPRTDIRKLGGFN